MSPQLKSRQFVAVHVNHENGEHDLPISRAVDSY